MKKLMERMGVIKSSTMGKVIGHLKDGLLLEAEGGVHVTRLGRIRTLHPAKSQEVLEQLFYVGSRVLVKGQIGSVSWTAVDLLTEAGARSACKELVTAGVAEWRD